MDRFPKSVEHFINEFKDLISRSPSPATAYIPRPYRNAVIRARDCEIEDIELRADIAINQANLNVFKFPASYLPGCDLLSDSGTTTMTMQQWSQLLLGDEAYGSNEGYYKLQQQISDTFGERWYCKEKQVVYDGSTRYLDDREKKADFFIFHQGRSAEFAFFNTLMRFLDEKPATSKAGDSWDKSEFYYIIPSNGHFDTTEANVHAAGIFPENLQDKSDINFRGNMDLGRLEQLLIEAGDRVPLVYITITNNTGGGQPVSMANLKATRLLAEKYDVPLFIDACRFAENAFFIKRREAGYESKTILEITHEMFENADGFHISFKKDGLVNIGGGLAINRDGLFSEKFPGFPEALNDHQILVEGHPTYGGLAGRDIMALLEGLRTVVREGYLHHRIGQVERFGKALEERNIPVMTPFGGHAVYIDMDRFFGFDRSRDEEFRGIAFTALMLIAGHRLCELGIFAFDKQWKTGDIDNPDKRVNNVRCAVPRLTYEDQDLLACAEAVALLYNQKDRIPGVRVDHGLDKTLRHFKADFSFLE